MALRALPGRMKERLIESRLPRVITLTDFDPDGVRFEVANLTEYYRVTLHGYETEYTAAMLGALRPSDVLYDVGANVGMVSLHAARTCAVHSFEPDPEFFADLNTSAELNPAGDLHLHAIAIGAEDGEVTLFTDGAAGNSPSLVRQRDESRPVAVTARSLDSIAAEGDLPLATVIKLDIEGAEILALEGGRAILSDPERGPRALFIEVHDSYLPGFGSSGDEVMALLGELGFRRTSYEARRNKERHLIVERD